jgi:hypothetical protein
VVTIDPWADAYREAQQRKLGYVGTDLLLLGVARTSSVAGDVLRDLGATPDVISAAIDAMVFDQPAEVDDARKQDPTDTPRMARARAAAVTHDGTPQSPAETLIALAYDRNGVHSAVLHQLGVDRGAIVARLADRGVKVPPNPPAPDPEPHSVQLVLPAEQADVVVRALSRATVTDQARFFDAHGGARWGFNAVPDRPGFNHIFATPGLGLREFAAEALRAAGYPEPPDDAWKDFAE